VSRDHRIGEDIVEALGPLGPVVVRRMFGGGGVFLDGLMFGLLIDDVLFLKVDDTNRADYEREGLEPFAYQKRDGKTTVMSFWRTPDRLRDEADDLVSWAKAAVLVARRAAAAKAKAKPGSATKRPRSARDGHGR
jgi:DNA transformation protein